LIKSDLQSNAFCLFTHSCYDAAVAMETTQADTGPISSFQSNPQLNVDAFCEKSFIMGVF